MVIGIIIFAHPHFSKSKFLIQMYGRLIARSNFQKGMCSTLAGRFLLRNEAATASRSHSAGIPDGWQMWPHGLHPRSDRSRSSPGFSCGRSHRLVAATKQRETWLSVNSKTYELNGQGSVKESNSIR